MTRLRTILTELAAIGGLVALVLIAREKSQPMPAPGETTPQDERPLPGRWGS